MGLFKFQNYSAIKNAQDNPRVEAVVETVNGNIFGVGDNVVSGARTIKEAQVLFADDAAAKGDIWVAMNIVDKPEIRSYADYSIKAGEYIRAFKLNGLIGEYVELSGDLVIKGGVAGDPDPAVGVKLIPTIQADAPNVMVWKTTQDATGYGVYLEITDVTAFGTFTIDNAGVGYEAKIKRG